MTKKLKKMENEFKKKNNMSGKLKEEDSTCDSWYTCKRHPDLSEDDEDKRKQEEDRKRQEEDRKRQEEDRKRQEEDRKRQEEDRKSEHPSHLSHLSTSFSLNPYVGANGCWCCDRRDGWCRHLHAVRRAVGRERAGSQGEGPQAHAHQRRPHARPQQQEARVAPVWKYGRLH